MVSVVADLSGFWLPAMHYICEERRHIPCRRISPNDAVVVCSTPLFLALLHAGRPVRGVLLDILIELDLKISVACSPCGGSTRGVPAAPGSERGTGIEERWLTRVLVSGLARKTWGLMHPHLPQVLFSTARVLRFSVYLSGRRYFVAASAPIFFPMAVPTSVEVR
jgi:hypothetical protein